MVPRTGHHPLLGQRGAALRPIGSAMTCPVATMAYATFLGATFSGPAVFGRATFGSPAAHGRSGPRRSSESRFQQLPLQFRPIRDHSHPFRDRDPLQPEAPALGRVLGLDRAPEAKTVCLYAWRTPLSWAGSTPTARSCGEAWSCPAAISGNTPRSAQLIRTVRHAACPYLEGYSDHPIEMKANYR